MSDRPAQKLTKRTYSSIFSLSAFVLALAALMLFFGISFEVKDLWCDATHYPIYARHPDLVCAISPFVPHYTVALIVALAVLPLVVWSMKRRSYWYEEVLDGEVMDFSWTAGGLIIPEEYMVAVRGKTRSGSTVTSWMRVQPRVYYSLKEGDTYPPSL